MPTAHPSLTFARSFSNTLSRLSRPSDSLLKHRHREIPKYPYGPATTYKQSNFGLYGNSSIQFGNKVSERNEIKSRRRWKPNIHSKRLWSEAMEKFVRVKVQARVLRTIDKVGGLDEYLLGDKAARIKEMGMKGWAMRWKLVQTKSVQERFRQQKMAMGFEVPTEEELKADEEAKAAKKAERRKLLDEERARRVKQSKKDKLRAKETEGSEKEVIIESAEQEQEQKVLSGS